MVLTVTLNPTIDRVYFIDSFKTGKLHRVNKVSRSAGGKGINVARVANILGSKTAATGFVGGYTGEFIKSETLKLGIENLFTQISGETRTSVNITDSDGLSSEILEEGPEISAEEKNSFTKLFSSIINDYDIVCASGSLPKGLSPDIYKEIVSIAKEKGKKIIVDTSGKALEEILEAAPYMVKPNGEEISEQMKKDILTDEDIKEALNFLKEKGVKVPFISLGKDGAAALIDECCYKFIVPEVKVVNTVGSGDSTVAGVCAGLDMGLSLEKAIRLGMASGIANTQFKETGIVTKELVEKFYNFVKVKKM